MFTMQKLERLALLVFGTGRVNVNCFVMFDT
jgi:hypothetical protein